MSVAPKSAPDDECHTRDADEHPEQTHGTEPVGAAGRQRDRGTDQRDTGDQQAGQRARDVLFGRPERDPRDGDLDRREGHDPAPSRQDLAQVGPDQRDRQQDGRRDDRPPEHQRRRRDLGHRDPDEQVRDAPDDRHQGEQDQRAAAHDGVRSPVLHLPGVVHHVVSHPADEELDRPGPGRLALRVVGADRAEERLPMRRKLVGGEDTSMGVRTSTLSEICPGSTRGRAR